MSEISYEFLRERIIQQKTILLIGPSLTVNFNDADFEKKELLKIKASCSGEEIISYHEDDNFLMFKDLKTKSRYAYKMMDIYKNSFKNPVLEKIAEIPFHAYFQVTPDLTLTEIMEQKQFSHQYNYYSGTRLRDVPQAPTITEPLVYHLFGSVKEEESIVVSHYDLFAYIKSLSSCLPENIKSCFNPINTKNIIFIGFEFDKWYYQLILSMLSNEFDKFDNFSPRDTDLKSEVEAFCKNQFNTTFVDTNITEFVENLYNQFKPEQLRQAAKIMKTSKTYIKPNIVKMLVSAFSGTDLETMCMCNFDKVYDEFNPEQSKTARVNLLMDYIVKNNKYEELLTVCKDENPVMFEKFSPYFE